MGGGFVKLQHNVETKVELSPFVAKHYEAILNALSFGIYIPFTKGVVKEAPFEDGDSVLDLGAGSGHFACLIHKKAKIKRYVGIDLSDIMVVRANERCKDYPDAQFIKGSISEEPGFHSEFDKVFISFVLHGFTQENRNKIIKNAHEALKPNGKFIILDYAERDVDRASFIVKLLIRKAECPLAEEFMKRDLKKMLGEFGFGNFEEKFFFNGYVRLEIATKIK